MPYIKQDKRLGAINLPLDAGELTFAITKLCLEYLKHNVENRFQQRAEVILALECAKLEFYRRNLAPYEDTKIAEHGDVY